MKKEMPVHCAPVEPYFFNPQLQKMATIGKRATRKTTKRRTTKGASKKRKSRVGAAAESPETIMISGIGRYKKASCHTTKTAAQKQAKSVRSQGGKARVLKNGAGFCVYKRGRVRAA